MTHEEFLGIKPEDDITLTDEDRAKVEATAPWQYMKLGEALQRLWNVIIGKEAGE